MKFILLTQGMLTTVDDKDFIELARYKWYVTKSSNAYYSRRNIKGGSIYMHRQIMNCPSGSEVHHIDGDTLNNQRSNLSICSPSQNCYFRRSG